MDIARLGLAVDSSQVEKGTVTLHQLTGAAGQASAAAQRLAGATTAEAAGHKAAAAAAQVHNAALMAQNTVIRSSMQQRTMMIYQLNDVAVSLASGMNPAMVAMQQGSQILQGGFAPALRTLIDLAKGFVVTFWPVAAVVGAVAAGVAGLAYEINKTAEVQVGFFDVALAGWQLFAESVASLVAPVFGAIGSWLQQGWDIAAPILKAIGNSIIGTFAFAIKAVGALWNGLPAAVGDAVITTANVIIKGVEWSINGATRLLNGFLSKYNEGLSAMGQKTIPLAGGVTIPQASNPYQGALGRLGADIGSGAGEAFGTDYMGGAFDALSGRAQQIAAARGEVDELGGAAKAANDNVKALANDGFGQVKTMAESFGEAARSAFSNLGSGIIEAFKKGGDIAGNVFNMLMDKVGQLGESLLNNGLNGLLDMGLNALMGAFGGFGMGGGMAGISSITGSSGGFFPGFAGGGYTGSGPRSGGLDGQGGFLAMMHPRETVTDHTRGAANQNAANQNFSRGDVHLHINGSGLSQAEMTAAIADALDTYDRFTLPNRVSQINSDPLARG